MKKTFIISLQLVLLISVLAVAYGFIRQGSFTLAYVVNACLFTGAFITFIGLLVKLFPAFIKFGKLTDHTTYVERSADKRLERQEKGNYLLFMGLLVIFITGFIQFVLAVLIPAS